MNEIISGDCFVETGEHLRFAEFCDACRDCRYIGLCHGPPGVGKTVSARRYAEADGLEGSALPKSEGSLEILPAQSSVFLTARVTNTPRMMECAILDGRQRLQNILLEPVLRVEEAVYKQEGERRLRRRELLRLLDWTVEAPPEPPPVPVAELLRECQDRRRLISDPTRLVLIDEADWLRVDSLEAVRAVFDRGGIGLVLIGMPGMEKRLARYPQLYSRIGFVHSFRALDAAEVRRLIAAGWNRGVLPSFEEEAVAALIRVTEGNFRLLDRLLSQLRRIVRINNLSAITPEAVGAARESLVIGQ